MGRAVKFKIFELNEKGTHHFEHFNGDGQVT